ncbi:MAG: glycosyl transferase [Chitinophagaceae bacterium]
MKGKKILFATFPADGHVNPLTGLAVYLKQQGYDMRWYTGQRYKQKIEKLGIQYYPLQKAIDFSAGEPDTVFPERKKYNSQIAKLKFNIKNAFVLRGPEFYEDIQEINRSFDFDLLVADVAFTGIPFVKQKLNKPVIAISVFPLVETSKDLPPNGLAITPSYTTAGRLKQKLLRFIADRFIFRDSKKLVEQLYRQYNMKPAKGNVFDMICREADLLLQSGTPGFEYHCSDLGKNVRFIGPLLPYTSHPSNSWQLPFQYRAYTKKVLVTQGTVETDVEKIIVPTLQAFRNTDVLVIATTGGSQTKELRNRFPDANFLIEDFIPFNEVMPISNAYITNGGYGGVLLGIQNKLPMVVAGVHEGKNEINARIGYFELGINLKTEKPSPGKIKMAVETIFTNKQYKKNVEKLANEFNEYQPIQLFEKYINELLQNKELSVKNSFVTLIRRHEKEANTSIAV